MMGQHHLESPERISLITNSIEESDLSYRYFEAKEASDEDILKIHSDSLMNIMRRSTGIVKVTFTPDTTTNMFTFAAAKTSAGGAIQVANNLDTANSFALLRPPGHHATSKSAQGFCFFNNVAIAAKNLIDNGIKRITIIDIDNHHGNGTSEIFECCPNILYISMHADPQISYPGTGFADEVGNCEGIGKTVNIPLPYKLRDSDYLIGFDEIVIPIVEQFDPEIILVSLGVDGINNDPYGSLGLSKNIFYDLGYRIRDLAKRLTNRYVGVFLEGGYKYEELGPAVVEFLRGIEQLDKQYHIKPQLSLKFEYSLREVKAIQRNYWFGI